CRVVRLDSYAIHLFDEQFVFGFERTIFPEPDAVGSRPGAFVLATAFGTFGLWRAQGERTVFRSTFHASHIQGFPSRMLVQQCCATASASSSTMLRGPNFQMSTRSSAMRY